MDRRKIPYTFILIAVLFLFAGCGPRGGPGPARPEPAKPGAPPPAKEAQRPPGPVPAPPAAARPADPAAPVRPFTSREDPLYAAPGYFVVPEDFTLGELQGGRETDSRVRETHELFRNFFTDLREGRSQESRILPDYRPFILRRILEFSDRKQPLTGVRIGRILLSDRSPEAAQAKVLLFGEKGRARGEIAAEKRDGAWYVSGFFIDFSDLERPYEGTEAGTFDPGPASGPF